MFLFNYVTVHVLCCSTSSSSIDRGSNGYYVSAEDQFLHQQSHLTPMKGSFLPPTVLSQVTSATHSHPSHKQRRSPGAEMTFIAKTFYDLRATTLEGDSLDFNVFRGRVVLIENVASLWGTTVRDFNELNQLQSKYPHRLVVLGFPCNQFGYQVSVAPQQIWFGFLIQYKLSFKMRECLELIKWNKCFGAGELLQWWDPAVPAERPSRQWVQAQLHHLWEVWRQRNKHAPSLCLSEGQTALPWRRAQLPHAGPQIPHLESHQQERHLLELWEVPDRARGRAL